MITFRLGDSLPLVKRLEVGGSKSLSDARKRQRLEALLDAGIGECHLRDPRIALLVETAFFHFNGERYHLGAWVVMPNHVHVLIETIVGYTHSDVVHSWKSFTAKKANKILGRTGQFWESEYFDRAIRDERHWLASIEYIHQNPVKAGLVHKAEDWPYSSARHWANRGGTEAFEDGGRDARTPSR